MGDSINMAARLMCLPEASSAVVCDEVTWKICRKDFEFEVLGGREVKGKKVAINVFKPLKPKDIATKGNEASASQVNVVGRKMERNTIDTLIANFSLGKPFTLLVEGDDGQGLSTLAEYTRRKAAKLFHVW
jgi:hypothetical protein